MTNKKKQMIIPDKSKSQKKPIPYQKRSDLTQTEINAINHYKDLVNKQHKWDYKPKKCEKDKNLGMDCFMVNNHLRGLLRPITEHDKKQLDNLIKHIKCAISKSIIQNDIDLIKGINNPSWVDNIKFDSKTGISEPFSDKAFGSYSTSKNIADGYAGLNKNRKRVYFAQTLPAGSKALYIDNDEYEYLLQARTSYIIIRVKESEHEIVYHLRRTK